MPRTFEQIEALEPHLIMVDLEIGQTAGWDRLQQLQTDAVTRDIPVIGTSTDPRLLERAEADQDRYAGSHWMARPFDLNDLVTSVGELVGTARTTAMVRTGRADRPATGTGGAASPGPQAPLPPPQ